METNEKKFEEIERIEEYPLYIKNNKMACKIWDIIRTKGTPTRTIVKNILYEEIFKEFSGGKECFEIIDELIRKDILKEKHKQTDITVLSVD